SDAALALDYATSMGAQLSSNSWGGGSFSTTLFNAIANADQAGVLFVAAAGNNASDNDATAFYPSSYSTNNGTTLHNVVSVAATDSNGALATFSDFGATSVDLAAPGVDIYSTLPGGGYGKLSGTSMATPHVAGVVALMLEREPNLTPTEVVNRLITTVTAKSGLSGKMVSGGIVNAFDAIRPGPVVKSSTPAGPVTGSVDRVQFTFDRDILIGSFTTDDIVTLTGPNGAISATAVNRINSTTYA